MNIKSKIEEDIKKEKDKIKNEFYSKVDFKLGYDITDFLVYIRHYIGKLYLEKPIQWFFICQKVCKLFIFIILFFLLILVIVYYYCCYYYYFY